MASKRTKAPTKANGTPVQHLRALGLAKYPGTELKSPWPGHLDLAVKGKTYAYLSCDGDPLSVALKLPSSSGIALAIKGAIPTPYGLGKSGWVSLSEEQGCELPPVAMLEEWLDESYRAQAPSKLLAQLDGKAPARAAAASAPKRRSAAARAPAKSTARRKPKAR